jgi:hypothetical protein
MIVTQQRQIVDDQGNASFLKQFANGHVNCLFIGQNQAGRKPNFTGTGLAL